MLEWEDSERSERINMVNCGRTIAGECCTVYRPSCAGGAGEEIYCQLEETGTRAGSTTKSAGVYRSRS